MHAPVEQVLVHNPRKPPVESQAIIACIDACAACEVACNACADACLGERDFDRMRSCVRRNQDCADLAGVTARVLGRFGDASPEVLRGTLMACLVACSACVAECQRHAGAHEHCRACADTCRAGEQACQRVLAGLPSDTVP